MLLGNDCQPKSVFACCYSMPTKQPYFNRSKQGIIKWELC